MTMASNEAIRIARAAFDPRKIADLDYWKSFPEQREGRAGWIVAFLRKEEEDVVVSPGEVFVEVDQITKAATILRGP